MPNTQQVRFLCEDKEEFEKLKAKATKLRIILLERKEKQMFAKLSSFSKREKDKFIAEINKMWSEMSDSEIDEEFNSICCDKLFEGGVDVSTLPVLEKTYPDHSVLYEPQQEIEPKLAHIENLSFEEVKCST
jgi:hypothetical protein